MSEFDRRSFLGLMAAGGIGPSLAASVAKAASIAPHRATGTIQDVKHVIFLMQENRSFDHYYGVLQGVRGFNDPRAVQVAPGRAVWAQPGEADAPVLPFRPDAADLGKAFIADLVHDWNSTHKAWNAGRWNDWIAAKSTTCMAYMTRGDIPFHYALADAFTVCDAYHCSTLSSTDPNRFYMWSGWVGNDGKNGGPVVDNSEAGYDWTTFPERMEAAGISWKIYQDIGKGLDAAGHWGWSADPYIGNYGDNSLLYFNTYRNAQPGSPLAEKARTGTNIAKGGDLFEQFRHDVKTGNLPSVSWMAAPEAHSEHPNWPAAYGAWYMAQVLDILTASPEVWSKTVIFITYDENDGFFDHMVPAVPPIHPAEGKSTVALDHEAFAGTKQLVAGPYGLGARVPMVVASPWTIGGWVNSEVFDHTSLIRFLEARFGAEHPGLFEPNITPWRRVVAGDLTSVFDFRNAQVSHAELPSAEAFKSNDTLRHKSFVPVPPAKPSMPQQESGIRRARSLPYDLHVAFAPASGDQALAIGFSNAGQAGAVFQLRDQNGVATPRFFTVEPGKALADQWDVAAGHGVDVAVHGPNGFFRRFVSPSGKMVFGVETARAIQTLGLQVTLANHSEQDVVLRFSSAYGDVAPAPLNVAAGSKQVLTLATAQTGGWYDLAVTAEDHAGFMLHLAGHLENGAPSITDPLMGGIAEYRVRA